MNQVPEKDILVRNQIQMYSKKISGQCNVTTRIEQVQDKKITLTGQRRNTMFQSCDYPHFICISFRQFDCYIYIIL